MADDYYARWVREGRRVEARYGTGDGVHAVGRVIGYVNRPTVIIETDGGEHVSWIADLCAPTNLLVCSRRRRVRRSLRFLDHCSTERRPVMPTELAARAEALTEHMQKHMCERDDEERGFLAGWDAAIASIREMTPAQVADHRKPGLTIQQKRSE